MPPLCCPAALQVRRALLGSVWVQGVWVCCGGQHRPCHAMPCHALAAPCLAMPWQAHASHDSPRHAMLRHALPCHTSSCNACHSHELPNCRAGHLPRLEPLVWTQYVPIAEFGMPLVSSELQSWASTPRWTPWTPPPACSTPASWARSTTAVSAGSCFSFSCCSRAAEWYPNEQQQQQNHVS